MKKIIIDEGPKDVRLSDIDESCPIFAKRDAGIIGMIIHENDGWILRFGSGTGATGHYPTREKCMISYAEYGYSFFTDI